MDVYLFVRFSYPSLAPHFVVRCSPSSPSDRVLCIIPLQCCSIIPPSSPIDRVSRLCRVASITSLAGSISYGHSPPGTIASPIQEHLGAIQISEADSKHVKQAIHYMKQLVQGHISVYMRSHGDGIQLNRNKNKPDNARRLRQVFLPLVSTGRLMSVCLSLCTSFCLSLVVLKNTIVPHYAKGVGREIPRVNRGCPAR